MSPRFLQIPELSAEKHNLLSVLSRISFAGSYLDVPGIARLVGLRTSNSSWRADLKLIVSGQYDLTTLANLCGSSSDVLSRLTYPVADDSSLWNEHTFLGHVIPWSTLDVARPRYCPHCIAESPAYPAHWDLVWYTTCHRHEVPLVQRCHECEARLEWSSWNWSDTCTACGERRSAPNPAVASAAVDWCANLSELVKQDGTAAASRPSTMGTLGEIMSTLSSLVVAAMPRAQLGRFDFSPHLWSIAERQDLVAFGWPLLKTESSSTAAIAEMFAQSRRAFPHLTDDSRCLPLRSAIELVPCEERRIWLQERLRKAGEQVRKLVARTSGANQEMATLQAAGTILGTSRHNILALLKAGMLQGRFAHEGRRRSDWLISIASIDALLGDLAKVCSHEGPAGDCIIQAAAKTPQGAAAGGLPGIVKAAREGRLRVVVSSQDYRLSSLTVDSESLQKLTEAQTSDALTVPEAAAKLGLYPDAVYRLMRLGFVPFRKEKRGTSPQRVVELADLARFSSTYAVVTQLAAEWKVNPTNLSDRLIDAGLVPASGPKVDGGLIYMFKRKDVARIDQHAILSRTTYKSRAGRPRKGHREQPHDSADVMDSTTAAATLGVSVQDLGRLVRSGILAEHSSSHRHGNRRYVRKQQVAELISRYSDNAALIPIEDVAQRLGRPVRSLYSKEIRAGRLKVDRSPLGRAFLYRDEVKTVFGDFQPLL